MSIDFDFEVFGIDGGLCVYLIFKYISSVNLLYLSIDEMIPSSFFSFFYK